MAALLIERGAELTPLAAAALGRWDYLASSPRLAAGKGGAAGGRAGRSS